MKQRKKGCFGYGYNIPPLMGHVEIYFLQKGFCHELMQMNWKDLPMKSVD